MLEHTKGAAAALLACVAFAALTGCARSYLQADSGRHREQFGSQHLVGKRFETGLPIEIFKLRNRQCMALHGMPLAVAVAGKDKPGDLIYYEPLMTLPAGTVLETVGEMSWSASPAAVNAPPDQRFVYFIAHGPPEARDLLLPFPSWLIHRGVRGEEPRMRSAADTPQSFLAEVDVPSQWTRARRDMIERAQWHSGIHLDLSRRAVPPHE